MSIKSNKKKENLIIKTVRMALTFTLLFSVAANQGNMVAYAQAPEAAYFISEAESDQETTKNEETADDKKADETDKEDKTSDDKKNHETDKDNVNSSDDKNDKNDDADSDDTDEADDTDTDADENADKNTDTEDEVLKNDLKKDAVKLFEAGENTLYVSSEQNIKEGDETILGLRDALRNAAESITLSEDITISHGYIIVGESAGEGDHNIVLDLNGHTITVEHGTATFAVNNGNTITVKNGNIVGAQTTEKPRPVFECNSGSTVIIDSVKVEKVRNAVEANNASLTIKDCTFDGNSSSGDGGAMNIRKTDFKAEGNNLFVNNHANGQGGAVQFTDMGTFTLENMTFKNNSSGSEGWGSGGGAVKVSGESNMTIDKGVVFENNFANGSGGAVLFGGKELVINGTFKGNIAQHHEGGAVSIIGNGWENGNLASIEGGLFEDNMSGYDKDGNPDPSYVDWGGGAIFVSDSSTLNVPADVLITGNHSGGFGGGLAGCSTGRVFVFGDENSSAMIFNNQGGDPEDIHLSGNGSYKHEDHEYAASNETFMSSGYDDYFCALNSVVSKNVFGDAAVTGSVDQKKVSSDDKLYVASYVTGITASLDNGQAPSSASIVIRNNTSYTHGGGILCNGYIVMGNPGSEKLSVGKSLEVDASKELLDKEGTKVSSLEGHEYTFTIKDEEGNTVLTGTNDENGKVDFGGRLSFDQTNYKENGVYKYYLTEGEVPQGDNVDGVPVEKDKSVIRIEVSVVKNETTQNVGGIDFATDKYEISGIQVYRVFEDGSEELIESSFTANDEMYADKLDLSVSGATFTNKTHEDPEEPKDPETPEDTKDSETPEDPQTPEDPKTPENPKTPETPRTPETPSNPEEPDVPEVPDLFQVFGARREYVDSLESPAVLGARRAATSDEAQSGRLLVIAVFAFAFMMLLRAGKKTKS
ncbi:hypothetical protein [Butyrivibrio sp. FCS014]|uniref:hypothetical protein n=1 Tax=Butyrivibrio sp. FCS014 TaxID=1408304 RepID=UPI000467B642|nr:hypothetical protein [Butyrivibrio sp. FCS014]